MASPDFAVLLPLQEARDVGAESLRAWLDQSLPRQRYELVFIAPGQDQELQRQARSSMAPHDRWLELPGGDEYALFNLGANATSAPWVFLTELHCVPDHRCLETMLEHLEQTGQPGARGASVGVGHGRMGELERAVYEDHLTLGGDDSHWRKVLIHSLTIRTDAYLAAGGLPSRYGDFAPWALAVELREQGHRLGYAGASIVEHHYTGELPELAAHVRDFALGEMRYWNDKPSALCRAYLDEPEEWAARGDSSRYGARLLLRQLRASRITVALCSRTALGLCWPAVVGPRRRRFAARARSARLRLRMGIEKFRRRPSEQRYRRMWEACARAARWEYLVRTPEREWLPDRFGVFADEVLDGRPFFWTGPTSAFAVDGRSRSCAIELLPVRALRPGVLPCVLLDGLPVEARIDGNTVHVALPAQGERWLGLASPPLRPWRHGVADRRELGVPVARLRWG